MSDELGNGNVHADTIAGCVSIERLSTSSGAMAERTEETRRRGAKKECGTDGGEA